MFNVYQCSKYVVYRCSNYYEDIIRNEVAQFENETEAENFVAKEEKFAAFDFWYEIDEE